MGKNRGISRKKEKLNLVEYKEALFKHGRDFYLKEFFKALNEKISSTYGEETSKEILRFLKRGILKIENIEYFLSSKNYPCDPSLDNIKESKSIIDFNRRVGSKCMSLLRNEISSLKICSYFFILARLLNNLDIKTAARNEDSPVIKSLLESLAILVMSPEKSKNPVTIQVCGLNTYSEVKEFLGIQGFHKNYLLLINQFFSTLEDFKRVNPGVSFPNVEVLTGVTPDYMENIRSYLSHSFGISIEDINKIIRDRKDFSKYTAALEAELTEMKAKGKSLMECYEVFLKLKEIQKSRVLKNFEHTKDYLIAIDKIIPRSLIGNAKQLFIPEGHISKYIETPLCEITVDCSRYRDFEEAKVAIGAAVILCHIKYIMSGNTARIPKVVLLGSPDYSESFVREAEKMEKKVKSRLRKPIKIVPCFRKEQASAFYGSKLPQYIRIISDMHVDHPLNIGKGYYFNFKDDFVINCGDTSSDALTTFDWVKNHMPNGIFVAGNHMGYVQPFVDKDKAKESYRNSLVGQIKFLANIARGRANYAPVFLQNKTYEYNGVIFIGTPLYTNFGLFGEEHKAKCIGMAKGMINDYRYVECSDSWGLRDWKKGTRKLTPQDHIEYYNTAYNFLIGELEKYKKSSKPVVVVTHFAPSYHCISAEYKNDALSAFFANNCSELFKNYNIRLWCFGHVHSPVDYIHNKTRVIACPFGYGNENNAKLPYNYGVRISFDDLKSTKSWNKIMKGKLPVID